MANPSTAIGNRLAPARFLAFLGLLAALAPPGLRLMVWQRGIMAAFDIAAAVFLASCLPMLRYEAEEMRRAAYRNDANRALLLAITAVVMVAVLSAVAGELAGSGRPDAATVALVIATLALCWLFSNTIYALHYAHIFYTRDDDGHGDTGGLDFPGTKEPDYADFAYFALTLGMTFQTSDVEMCSATMRRVALGHCVLAFLFNIGVLAFTVNVLGGSG